ncbi:hypothetical protein [Acinetobacter sp. WZC-1]|uniref:hypothetical protein n=1 Tax=Acinetobacter sp. WZC-1 TaxID=3459034 RepID=UPI00403DECE9
MKKISTLLAAALMLSLTACAVHTPAGSVIVDPDGHGYHDHRGNGDFCPPGQAKKGRC